MCRPLLIVLLLAPFAGSQSIDDWIDIALDPRTSPEQRSEAMKKIATTGTKDVFDKLGAKGLDPAGDPEVVHSVVFTLLKYSDYKPYLPKICRLLAAEKHRVKVLYRIQQTWETDRGMPLLEGFAAIAKETNEPAMREAAILALSKFPRRVSAETIIDVGLDAPEGPVKDAARVYVARWFGVATLKDAKDLLAAHPRDSFWEFAERRVDTLMGEKRAHDERMKTFWERAPLVNALDALEKGGPDLPYVAKRLGKIAEENGIPDPAGFTSRVYRVVAHEIARDTPESSVLVPLLGALQRYAGELMRTGKPDEVRATIQKVAEIPGSGPEYQSLGAAAVDLLGVIDEEGRYLYPFAEKFPSVEVRKRAIQQLGQLAQRFEKQRSWVSIRLATLLKDSEKEPAVRALILNLLTQPHITVVIEPVDVVATVLGYLEKGTTPELTDAELRDCAIVLGKRRTPEVTKTLLTLAATHPKLQVRQFVIEEGLVPWAREDVSLHDELIRLALDSEQPPETRKAVVQALGRRGGFRAATTLSKLEADAAFDEALRAPLKEAKLVLAKRLVNNPEGATAQDLDAAGRLVDEETSGADAERLDRLVVLAGEIITASERAKVKLGSARYRLATLSALLPAEKRKEEDLLKRYRDAATNAVPDGLPPALREKLLQDFRTLLLKDPANKARVQEALDLSVELAGVSEQDNEKAARYLLDAADAAVLLGKADRVRELCDRAAATGGVVGELVGRSQELRGKADRLAKG